MLHWWSIFIALFLYKGVLFLVKGQEMELALGLPVYIDDFIDGVPRKCFPYKLSQLSILNMYLTNIDEVDFESLQHEQLLSLTYLLSDSFKECELEDVVNNIDSTNYNEIISDIKYVSGISDDQGEIDIKKSSDALSWSKSTSAIQKYTSNSHKDICDMTLRQFNSILEFIGAAINWDYKVLMVPHVKDADNFIADKDHPLSSDIIRNNGKKRMTMKDMQSFMDNFTE